MKKTYLFLALAAMGVAASCSNDEVIGVNSGSGIDFSVTAGKQTRVAATTTNTINDFKVWALVDNGGSAKLPYMNATDVIKGSEGKWTYDGTKFWPENPLDFYAVSPADVNGVTVGTISQSIAYTVTDGMEDLLYSASLGQKKADHISAPVAVNFRHALSQVVFRAKLTENSSYSVKIKGIKVDGVANAGTFAWATESTGYSEENDTETGASWGEWSVGSDIASYNVNLSGEYDLTADVISFADNSLFLMPQKLNPWLTKGEDGKDFVTGSARVLVDCQIIDNESGIQLWPAVGAAEGWVAVSLNNPVNDPNRGDTAETQAKHDKWMQGKKYIYTLIFGEGAGYDPNPKDPDPDKDPDTDPDPDEDPDPKEEPVPVLVPIRFEVSIDAFQNGGEYDASGKTE